MAAIPEPEHIVCDDGVAVAVGVGFTSTDAVIEGPGQPLAVGVIVKITVWGVIVVLVNVPLILPLPAFEIPVTLTVLFLVQLKVVAGTDPVNTIVVIGLPEHAV